MCLVTKIIAKDVQKKNENIESFSFRNYGTRLKATFVTPETKSCTAFSFH